MIEVSVKGANAVCTNPLPLTTGMNGVKVKFNFSRGWDNLTPLAVFTNGRTTLDAIITDDIATIPHEVLALKNRMVLVGIYGVDTENNIVVPTIYAELGYVSLGADPTGDESAVTSPALYEQAIEKAENALDISREAAEDATTALGYATEVKQKADAGELDGFSPSATVTKDGSTSTITITDKDGTTTAEVTDGRTPVKGTDYFTSDDITAVRAGLENMVNKTTVISPTSTNTQYPSAKAVRDFVMPYVDRISNKMDQPNNGGTPGQVLKLTEDGTEWADESGGGEEPLYVEFYDLEGDVLCNVSFDTIVSAIQSHQGLSVWASNDAGFLTGPLPYQFDTDGPALCVYYLDGALVCRIIYDGSGTFNTTNLATLMSHTTNTTIHVTAADKTKWNGKQNAISDLSAIRAGAAAGATALQELPEHGHTESEITVHRPGEPNSTLDQYHTYMETVFGNLYNEFDGHTHTDTEITMMDGSSTLRDVFTGFGQLFGELADKVDEIYADYLSASEVLG